jgi:hypothetical protein
LDWDEPGQQLRDHHGIEPPLGPGDPWINALSD